VKARHSEEVCQFGVFQAVWEYLAGPTLLVFHTW